MNQIIAVLLVLASSIIAGARAEELKIPFQGLTLVGNLEMAEGKSLKDGVIVTVHGNMAHYGMEMIEALQGIGKERGYNTLAINLSLGVNERHGMHDCTLPQTHRRQDAINELGAWIDWLKSKGAKNVVLEGHSMGANQVALFMAERNPDLVRVIVLLAPTTWDNEDVAKSYAARGGRELKPTMDRAHALVEAGKGDTMMPDTQFLTCANTATVSAASFASYYTTAPDRDTPNLIARIKKPVLVLAAQNDTIHYKVAEKFAPVADGERVRVKTIDGADAFFRDLYAEDAVDAILEFVAAHLGSKA